MFDWDRFKNGEIAVHCDTEEKANDFLKECDKKGMRWVIGDDTTYDNNYYKYVERTCYRGGRELLTFGHENYFKNKGIEIIKWEVKEMKELTFKEVIANIKENEVWESDYKTVEIKGSVLEITDKYRKIRLRFGDDTQFKLQRKEYTFEEAFKALKIGKEIESLVSGEKYEIIESEFRLPTGDPGKNIVISYKEIEGKWYIND